MTMKTEVTLFAALGLALFPCLASAASRTSADYSITTESIDQGGTLLTSTNYSVNASVNDSGATASEATCGYLAKGGYIGQLFDVTGVIPTAPASTVNEATLLPLSPTLAAWSVVSGPLSGIDANGLASAAVVYQDSPAVVRTIYQGFTGTLSLTVLNVNTDDYGSYSGDGIPDDWQTQYFGQNNPNAAPNKDADGTGQTNLFKYTAGLNPTDRTSVFRVAVQPVSGQPTQKQIVCSPVLPDRTYTVLYKTNMTDSTWSPLTGTTQADNGQQRIVTDTSAAGKTKFYRVQISKP